MKLISKSVSTLFYFLRQNLSRFIEWAIINKTLEAADKAPPVKPARVLPPVPRDFPERPASRPGAPTQAITETFTPEAAPSPGPSLIASASRPTIKLKVGAQTKSVDPPSSKPRARKLKTEPSAIDGLPIDAPPPPYVDDGSHDILQEVLAIEREKDEQRQRSTLERDRPLTIASSNKRKKTDSNEDDILAFATPSKKERPTPPSTSSVSSTSKPIAGPSTVPLKSGPTTLKLKKQGANTSRSSTADMPRISLKGKEKEGALVVSAQSHPKSKKQSTPSVTPINKTKCKDLLKNLQRMNEAIIFLQPVNPVLDGCPTYVSLIS